ncbi:MAG: phosphoribosylaminoimidazolesuccinocarboxamide synthase [Pseudomonadota bacterium]
MEPIDIRSKEKLYEGSSKILYEGEEEYSLIQFFKDDFKLPNKEIIQISGKGVLNNKISAFIMESMDISGIENHFLEKINMREQRVQLLDIVPVQVCISNISAGRYVTELGVEEGYVFDSPMIDFRLKYKEHPGAVMNERQLVNFGWMTEDEVKQLKIEAFRAGAFLTGLFAGVGIRMVECHLEFGRVFDGESFVFMLADEITPDTCRLWDIESNERFDFESIATNPQNGIEVYKEIAKRFRIS